MKTDTEIRHEGFTVLFEYMDRVDAERFISLIQRERFDYTAWRQNLFEEMTIEEISARAMAYAKSQQQAL